MKNKKPGPKPKGEEKIVGFTVYSKKKNKAKARSMCQTLIKKHKL